MQVKYLKTQAKSAVQNVYSYQSVTSGCVGCLHKYVCLYSESSFNAQLLIIYFSTEAPEKDETIFSVNNWEMVIMCTKLLR